MLILCQIRAVMALAIQCTIWSLILAVAAVIIAAVIPEVSLHFIIITVSSDFLDR